MSWVGTLESMEFKSTFSSNQLSVTPGAMPVMADGRCTLLNADEGATDGFAREQEKR